MSGGIILFSNFWQRPVANVLMPMEYIPIIICARRHVYRIWLAFDVFSIALALQLVPRRPRLPSLALLLAL